MAEATKSNQAGRPQLLKLIHDYDTAIFTTVSPDGSLHSRPMATQKPQPDMDIWFVGRLDSTKIRDLEANPRINLAYYDKPSNGYVSISARVRLNRDRARIAEVWEADWKLWFPLGKDDPDITLIIVEPEQAEYIDPATSKWSFIQAIGHAITSTDAEDDEVQHLDQADLRK
jgi:general stress protein 26